MNFFLLKWSATILRRVAYFTLTALMLCATSRTNATHISGADLTYTWISGNTFELELTLYRDCSGITAPNAVSINYRSATCGYNLSVVLNKKPGTGQEITQPCSSSPTTCGGGISPGIQKYEYIGLVTLPARCSDWVFGYSICCRNCAITTLTFSPPNCSGAPATYIEATLNNLIAPNNSSPVFSNLPVAFFCIGQAFHYNHGAYDANGDSVVYSFIPPRSAAGTNVTFAPGYSATNPISSSPPLSLSSTGDIVLNPTAGEVGVMAILVREYRGGILIGSVIRDMQVYTQPCTNRLPTASGVNGTNSYSIVACPGKPLSFNILSNDLDNGQIVSMDWDGGIANGSFTTNSSNRPTGTFTWTPTLADAQSQAYTFTITVKDNNCPSKGIQAYSYSVLVPGLSLVTNTTDARCAGSATGSASVLPTGTAPFQYSWSPGSGSTSTINGLAAGIYTVRVTDQYGCTSTSSKEVYAPPVLSANISSTTNVRCFGGNGGSASIIPTGGTSPYTYSWSPSGGTMAAATGMTSGNYSVRITDGNNCSYTLPVSISQAPQLNSITNSSSSTCGFANGSASITASGGTAPFNYTWNTGSTLSSISNLLSGTYQATITDAQNCSVTTSVSVSNINGPTSSIASLNHARCSGANDGSAVVVVNGGTGPYTYQWSNGASNTSAASSLAAGNYSVIVTDANNCTSISAFTINQPPVLQSSGSSNPVSCYGGSDGQVSVNAFGGSPPYSYNWTPGGSTNATLTSISSGTYTARVTDRYGCTSICSNSVNSATQLSVVTVSNSPVRCAGGNDGSARIAVSGGTAPYSYQWMPYGGTSATANGLDTGTYTVRIRDANNCIQSINVTISEPSPLRLSYSTVPAGCNLSNGSASINVSGGTSPYNYSWSQVNSNSPILSNIRSGSYQVRVSDANNCELSTTIAVSNTSGPTSVISTLRNVNCHGGSDGSAGVVTNGGTAPFTYQWSGSAINASSISNLMAGSYSVSITDANNCVTALPFTISQPSALSLQSIVTNTSCFGGNDGQMSVSSSGGNAPYTYTWSSGNSTNSGIASLSSGSYSAIITDQNGCTASVSNTVSSPPPLSGSVANNTAVNCYGGNDGTATVSASGGTSPYSYSWSPYGGSNATATGLSAGIYSVTIRDANNCISVLNLTISEPPQLTVTTSGSATTCGLANGTASAFVSGGVQPYTYLWNPNGETGSTISNVAAGTFQVEITDAHSCNTMASISLADLAGPQVQISNLNHVSCNGVRDASVSLTVSGGRMPISYQWSGSTVNAPVISNLGSGNHTVTITDANNCSSIIPFTITEPPALRAQSSTELTRCFGTNDGQATLIAGGGTPPYAYSWSTGNTTSSTITGLAAGNYTATITDRNGCVLTQSLTINSPTALNAGVRNTSMVSCFGGHDGSGSVVATGGTAPYFYSWTPYGGNLESANNLDTGIYSVTIKDANNCISTVNVSISQPPPLEIAYSTNPAGCNLANGSASVSVTGGTRPLTYLWNSGNATGSTLTNIPSGSYQVTITDAKNCVKTTSIAISNTSGPTAQLSTVLPVSCFGGNDGQATVSISTGTAPYIYQWSSSTSRSATASNLSAGNHSVTITDSNNCVTALAFIISEPPLISTYCTSTPASCYGKSNGQAAVSVSGGTAPYTYNWSNGQSDSTIFQLPSGTYRATVTDSRGCISTSDILVQQPNALILRSISTPVTCYGGQDGQAIVQCSGGTAGYSYSWSNGSTHSTITGLPAGNYSVLVTDANGCTESNLTLISEPSPLATSFTKNDASCKNFSDGSATINVSGGVSPYSYHWSASGSSGSSQTNLHAGNYLVTINDAHGCPAQQWVQINEPDELQSFLQSSDVNCFGGNDGSASITVTGGTSPYHYYWNDGQTGSSVTQLTAGLHSVSITDQNGCNINKTVLTKEPTSLSLSLSDPQIICIGQSSIITVQGIGGTSPYNFIWGHGVNGQTIQVSPSQSTTYTVHIADAKGCISNPDSVIVRVHSPLLAITAGTDSVCVGGVAYLSANASGGDGGPYTYNWSNGSNQQNTSVQINNSTTYTVTVQDNCGSPSASTTFSVTAISNPDPTFLPFPVSGCVPLKVPFNSKNANQNQLSHYWNFGDGNYSTEAKPEHIYMEPGIYTVTHLVTNSYNCSAEETIPQTATAFSLPVADFYSSPEAATVQSPVISFSNESHDAIKYVWNFGDETGLSTLTNPEHQYSDTGTFLVQLISENVHGCTDTITKPVRIKGEFAIYIPSAFTPNRDGINETFFPLTMGAKDVYMVILDRWGLEIFHSSDEKEAWDGKRAGSDNPCQMDVYVYIVQASDMDGRQYRYTGRVSLIR